MNRSKGFIDTIVLVIIALIVLGYFNIDIKHILSGPVVKDNLMYLWDATKSGIVYLIDFFKHTISSWSH
jgi:hypothetical protein